MSFIQNKRTKFILIGLTIALPIAVIGSVAIFSEKPPLEKLNACQRALAAARKEEAYIYSPSDFAQAEKLWQEAMRIWEKNNKKTKILRKFDGVTKLTDRAIGLAEKSQEYSVSKKKELHAELKREHKNLKEITIYIEKATNKLPLNHGIRNKLTPAKLKLQESESAYARNDLLGARKSLMDAKTVLEDLSTQTSTLLKNYFSNYPVWIRLNEEMRLWSKNQNSVSLVVDKFSRKCFVYNAGKKIKEFEVELGLNWLGDKRHRGDMATPEGKYSIVSKKSGSKTIYHKALLINFPNEEDKRQFDKEKAKGNISRNLKIGDSIEIHGGGGKGIDWTEGCVALENRDMDLLFSLCSVGTPVAIVGSLVPLEDIIEFN